jgi:tetratricopeptide (TPR) repeat protein
MLPLLLVGSHRPTPERSPLAALGAALSPMRRFRTMPMGQLSREGARDMMRELISPEAAADSVVAALPLEIAGLPEALVEAAATLSAEGRLDGPPDGPWTAFGEFDPGRFDGSLEDLMERRLGLLSRVERETLEMASVQGLVFDGDVTRRALELDDDAAHARFEGLSDRGYLTGEYPVWRFPSNDMFQRVHDGLTDESLVDCHRRTADAFLASRNPEQSPPSELHGILNYRVAWHYLLAGENARGLLYMPAAIIHLRDTWRIGDAERLSNLASRALTGDAAREGDLIALLLERGELLGLQGRRVEQREVISEALLRARDHDDPISEARVVLESARLRLVTGHLERARDEGREAMRIAQNEDDARLESNCQQLLGIVAFREGRYQQARTHMQSVLELSRNIRDEEAEAEALQTLGTISQDVGSWLHAEELQRQAMAIHRRAGDLASEAEVLTSLGAIAAANDDPVRGEQYLRRAVAIHRARGDGYGEAQVLGQLGLLMQDSWRLAEARSMHAESCRASREIGARQEELAALINLATVEYLLGALDDARDNYGDALRAAREIGDLRLEGYALTGLGDVGRQCGELTIAEGLIERAIKKLDGCDDPGGLAVALLAHGRIAILRGDDADGVAILGRAQDLSRGANTRSVTALCLALLGLLAARSGDADVSSARFAAAREQLEALGEPGAPTLVEVVFLESLALRVRREKSRGERLLKEARELLDRLAERLRDEDRERYLTASSPAREVMAGTSGGAKAG